MLAQTQSLWDGLDPLLVHVVTGLIIGWLGARLFKSLPLGAVSGLLYLVLETMNLSATYQQAIVAAPVFFLAGFVLGPGRRACFSVALLLLFAGLELWTNWHYFVFVLSATSVSWSLLLGAALVAEGCRFLKSQGAEPSSLDLPATKSSSQGAQTSMGFVVLLVGSILILYAGGLPALGFLTVILAWSQTRLTRLAFSVLIPALTVPYPIIRNVLEHNLYPNVFVKAVAGAGMPWLQWSLGILVLAAAIAAAGRMWRHVLFALLFALSAELADPAFGHVARYIFLAALVGAMLHQLNEAWRPTIQAPQRPSPAPGSLPHP